MKIVILKIDFSRSAFSGFSDFIVNFCSKFETGNRERVHCTNARTKMQQSKIPGDVVRLTTAAAKADRAGVV